MTSYDEFSTKDELPSNECHKETSLGELDGLLIAIGSASEAANVEIFDGESWDIVRAETEDSLYRPIYTLFAYSLVEFKGRLLIFGELVQI